MGREQDLNRAQQRAVAHRDGPARVLAGAGTGKTRVITERFIALTGEGAARPEQILVLTFSRAAAEEMRSRIIARLRGNYTRLWIKTFHSFCLEVLRETLPAGEGGGFQVIGDHNRRMLIAEVLAGREWGFYRNNALEKFTDDVFNLLSRLKDELVPLSEFERFAREQQEHRAGARLLDLARACRLVQSEMESSSLVDYADMITRTMNLFQKRADLLEGYRSRFKYIMVDEFQDTNRAQFELLQVLAVHGNLYVVGDDDQAIYRFRGATDRFILEFEKYYPDAITYKLEENYRSQKIILDVANQSIKNNRRVEKELTPGLSLPEQKVKLVVAATESAEAEYIARTIREKVVGGTYTWGDFAVLCRSVKNSACAIRLALERAGVPYLVVDLEGEVHPAVSGVMDLLRLALGEEDQNAVARLAFKGNILEYYRLKRCASERELDFWRTLCSPSGEVSQLARSALTKLWAKVEELRGIIDKAPLAECVYRAALLAGCLHVPEEVTPADMQRLGALKHLLEAARDAAQKDMDLAGFISTYMPGPVTVESADVVRIMTVHQAKGLEFPVVFVPGLVEGLFPTGSKLEPAGDDELIRRWLEGEGDEGENGPSYLEEERRLFYVAVTRARRELYLTHAFYYNDEPVTRSLFLDEIAGRTDLIEEYNCSGKEVLAGDETTAARRARASLINAVNYRGYDNCGEVLRDVLHLQYLQGRLKTAVPLRVGQPARPYRAGDSLDLSVSALNTYRDCPRKYFLEYVLGFSEAGGQALVFGQVLHEVLAKMNRYRRDCGELPPVDLLMKWYRENWREDVYECLTQARQNFERGEIYLRRYYKYELGKSREILAVEEWFSVPYTDLKKREHRLRGRYDLVARDPATGTIEIIDYKTGKRSNTVNKKNKKDISGSSPKDPNRSLQLALYHHAYTGGNADPNVITSLYFLRHQHDKFADYVEGFNTGGEGVISTGHTKESLALVHQDVTEIIDGLLENRFSDRPDNAYSCRLCSYTFVCEVMDDVIR